MFSNLFDTNSFEIKKKGKSYTIKQNSKGNGKVQTSIIRGDGSIFLSNNGQTINIDNKGNISMSSNYDDDIDYNYFSGNIRNYNYNFGGAGSQSSKQISQGASGGYGLSSWNNESVLDLADFLEIKLSDIYKEKTKEEEAKMLLKEDFYICLGCKKKIKANTVKTQYCPYCGCYIPDEDFSKIKYKENIS